MLLEDVDVRVTDERGVTMTGVPMGTDEYVLERAMGVTRDGGAKRLARCLADMPNKEAATLIAIEPRKGSGRGTVSRSLKDVRK